MKMIRILAVALLVASIIAIHGQATSADERNKMTIMTFSGDVQVPGATLPAGTYVFQLVDSDYRHIVRIFNADQTKLITTIMAIPDYQVNISEETVVNFEEGRSDEPAAIESWFYPGDSTGQHFVYPKAQEEEFTARRNVGQPAPLVATEIQQATSVSTPTLPLVEDATTQPAPVAVAENHPEPAISGPSVAPKTPEPQGATEPSSGSQGNNEQLPHTASNLPLIGLAGLLLVGTALILRVVAHA